MARFVIKDWYVFARGAENIHMPVLPDELQEWFDESNITEYDLVWVPNENVAWPPKDGNYAAIRYETGIKFRQESDAVLFKLRWFEKLLCL